MKRFLNYLFALVAGLTVLTAPLQAEDAFDPTFSSEITSAKSHLIEPSKETANYWVVLHHLNFDNGLRAFHYLFFDTVFNADECVFRSLPKGKANILVAKFEKNSQTYSEFKLIFENYTTEPGSTLLAIDASHDFSQNPKVAAFSVNEQVIKGWFANTKQFQYLVQLDNGSVWASDWLDNCLSKSEREEWDESPVIIIGNSTATSLVKAKKSKHLKLTYSDVLPNLKQMR